VFGGLVYLSVCLKNWGAAVGFEPFAPQGEALGFEFSPGYESHFPASLDIQ